ncbi:hypothetical protein [Jiella marina]|uniref:hypothetical protein n=1 Tax=Jiella sp. LLJ827 TaxID=2917712 RepID=UPI002100AD45|nr:hypothetical protein [Jiella sp. LLJ827]MCQ0987798.1 hypothetical protein [Jiella sp. LLJ827]
MLLSSILLAGAIAIPFSDAPAPGGNSAPADIARYETMFEFAESDGGYRLNAVVVDLATGNHRSVAIGDCRTININSFEEGLFGTPVVCNGVDYSFDVRQGEIVVDASTGGRPAIIQKLEAGHAMINGMPLLIEASRAR